MLLTFAVSVCGVAFSVAHAKSIENTREQGLESLVLQCTNSCDAIASVVEGLGGTVSLRYANVNALAIKVPSAVVERISTISGVSGLGKDRLIAIPYPFAPLAINQTAIIGSDNINPVELDELLARNPANYNFNNGLTGVSIKPDNLAKAS